MYMYKYICICTWDSKYSVKRVIVNIHIRIENVSLVRSWRCCIFEHSILPVGPTVSAAISCWDINIIYSGSINTMKGGRIISQVPSVFLLRCDYESTPTSFFSESRTTFWSGLLKSLRDCLNTDEDIPTVEEITSQTSTLTTNPTLKPTLDRMASLRFSFKEIGMRGDEMRWLPLKGSFKAQSF